MNVEVWNSRYQESELAYGEECNVYLASMLSKHYSDTTLPLRVLCLAEGQGRNALFIAKQYPHSQITAVDFASVGIEKTLQIASQMGVDTRVKGVVADLAEFDMGHDSYDLVISIFAHTPSSIRKRVHSLLQQSLSSHGKLILQAYTSANIGRGTGGPQAADFCMSLSALNEELIGLHALEAQECESEVHEGKYHQGIAAVVQGVWSK